MIGSGTVAKLNRIPMLDGLVQVTLYELPVTSLSQVHGTYPCYRNGCRCGPCRQANADRVRDWYIRAGRTSTRYPAADARRAER